MLAECLNLAVGLVDMDQESQIAGLAVVEQKEHNLHEVPECDGRKRRASERATRLQ